MADQTVEVRFEFRHVFTCGDGQAEIERRIESMRARFERELQLATKNDRVRLSAHRGITDPPKLKSQETPEEVMERVVETELKKWDGTG